MEKFMERMFTNSAKVTIVAPLAMFIVVSIATGLDYVGDIIAKKKSE